MDRKLRIAFLHPDLGLGGAERLVVDAAHGLAQQGHSVTMYTSHYQSQRSFAETRDGSFPVIVHGDWLPRHIYGMLHILFAILRSIWLAFAVAFSKEQYDIFICDQVSACVPILRLFRPSARILFYCHYPDQLLSARKSLIKRLYRLPFDIFEEITTGMAHEVVVNSQFTRSVFLNTFTLLKKCNPAVLYPCIQIDSNAKNTVPHKSPVVFLSINRYERKKNIELALKAFAHLEKLLGKSGFQHVHLIIAGGYDTRVPENVEYYEHLTAQAESLGLSGGVTRFDLGAILPAFPSKGANTDGYEQVESGARVSFVRSFTDEQKKFLLRACSAIIYTPSFEHFGIVPLEAMAAFRPVISVNNGGPLESIVDGRTGFLREPQPEAFAEAMSAILQPNAVVTMGEEGRKHVVAKFSRAAFVEELQSICHRMSRT